MNASTRPTGPWRTAEDGEEAQDEAVEVRDLGTVVQEQLPSLLRYAAALTGERDLAGDLVQEVLLRAHKRRRRIELLERPDLELRRMVTNEHLTWRRWHVCAIPPVADAVLAARAVPDHAQAVVEHAALEQALAGLSPRCRSVLVLRFLDDLNDAEIAVVLGTTPATVSSRVSRALAALRVQGLTGRHGP